MMLPSWFARLRDVKAGSIKNEQSKLVLHTPSLAAKSCDKDPVSFAKSWSLRRASSKANSKCPAADTTTTCDDSYPSVSGHEVPSLGCVGNVRSVQESEPSENYVTPHLVHAWAKLDPWDCNFPSVSSRKRVSKPFRKEMKLLVMQKGHGVSDNDTEDFAITPETRSSFCSETSSEDSNVSCKGSFEEKGNQDNRKRRKAGVNVRSSGGVVSKGAPHICAAKERIVQMRRETWRGKGSLLFSYLTVRKCKGVCSNAEAPNMFDQSNTGKDSLKISKSHKYVENKDKENAGKARSGPKERDRENWTVLVARHNSSNADTLDKLAPGKSSTVGEANLNMLFDHGDAHGCCLRSLDSSNVDPRAQNVCFRKRSQPNSITEDGSAVVSSSCCTPPEVGRENKSKVLSMRRRQRGASISAVLPPNLQGVVGDSLALVKMSDDPSEDFRQSIYEMIMEKDLEGSMDVEELLHCYLSLNAPEHHGLITEVFSSVWSTALMTLR